jgi:hypothetical protein
MHSARTARGRPAPPPGPDQDPDTVLAHGMRAALTPLLDSVAGSRKVLVPLAAVERVLDKGLPALGDLPLAVIEKARDQLAKLPFPQEEPMLPQLLSLLSLTVQSRQAPPDEESRNAFLSSFMTDEKLSVTESSHTEFSRACEALDAPRR